MKTKLLTIVCCASASIMSVCAQPIIQNGSNVPAVGFTAVVSGAGNTVAPGTGGANITWDLSGLSPSELGAIEFVTPSTTPYFSTFPSSNLCIKITPTGSSVSIYQYDKVTATRWDQIANSYAGPGTGKDYTANPESFLKFPFQYNESFIDTFQSTSGGVSSVTITYDGYGTLKTPFGTYNNVVRVMKYWGPGDYNYNWYTLNPLAIMASFDAEKNSYTLTGATATNITESAENVSVQVFP